MRYRVGRWFVRLFVKLYHRMRVEGRAHVPAEGGVLILSNHQSFLDIPIVAAALERHVAFVARDTLAKSAFLRFWMKGAGAILIRRGAPDRAALEEIVEHLKLGDCVVMFPEGTRTRDGSLGELRGGALLVARRAGVPIVPASIRGAIEAMPRGVRLPRPRRVAIRFGQPLQPRDPEALEKVTRSISAGIGDGTFDSVPSV